MKSIEICCVAQDCTVRQALQQIERASTGIALIIDDAQRLLGTMTDGDARRSILNGLQLDSPVSEILARKAKSAAAKPLTVPEGTPRETILRLMQERVIRHVPVVDGHGRVVELVTLEELMPKDGPPLQAVIMAGGFGKRLYPLTENLPKPMLPVGDKPLMELIVNQLKDAGIDKVNVTTHFEPGKIKDHFGDGSSFGVQMNYVSEETPLGTAGALSLMDEKGAPLLVINGDILTQVDFRAMLAFHREHHADLTVGVRQYDFQVPYGVIESDGAMVTGVQEKPTMNFFVNAGIYLLEPSVHDDIPQGQRFDMTDLIKALLSKGRPVANFPIVEYWLDIGQHADYIRAQEDIKGEQFA